MIRTPNRSSRDDTAGRDRRSLRGLPIVAGTTGAFALAGYLASLVVPVAYTASVELATTRTPEASTFLEKAAATEPANDIVVSRPEPGRLLLSANAAVETEAWRRVGDLATRIEARFLDAARSVARVPAVPIETQPSETVSSEGKGVSPSPTDREDTSATLRNAASVARREADAIAAELRDTVPERNRVDDKKLSALLLERANAQAALAALRQLRSSVADARPASQLAVVKPSPTGWSEWIRLTEDRARLQAQVTELSRTLLDGHPRMAMARLRLADLDEDVARARQAVIRSIDSRIPAAEQRLTQADAELRSLRDAETAEARDTDRRARLEQDRDVALRLAERLERSAAEVEAATPGQTDAPTEPRPPTETAPAAPAAPPETLEITRKPLPTQIERADPLPVVGTSALFGLLVSGVGVAFARRSGRPDQTAPEALPQADEPTANAPPTSAPVLDITPIDDVIDAAIASNVTRIMLTGDEPAHGARPIAVNIARRLSLRGQAVALVDLSASQAAARTMGISASAPTISNLIEGSATFATVAARDFATQAEIVPGGAQTISSPLDTTTERRNVLDFVEKSYEAIIVDCTDMKPEQLASLMDTDAALLVAVDSAQAERAQHRIEQLRQVGLSDMILISDTRAA